MGERREIQPRKRPGQARALQTEAAILAAAERVLARNGGSGITTNHVAEEAGISIGTLYQYYPNKAAILFTLQIREMEETVGVLRSSLQAEGIPYEKRFRAAVRKFFESECAERLLRSELAAVQPLFEDEPALQAIKEEAADIVGQFLRAWLGLKGKDLKTAAELVLVTVTGLAERVSEREPEIARIRWWANECTEMLLSRLLRRHHGYDAVPRAPRRKPSEN